MDLWIVITLAAAAVQTLRFALQRQVKAAGLSTAGATFSRFVFAVPLAAGVAWALANWHGEPWPDLTRAFWAYAFFGGMGQIVGTFCTVALFGLRNFAVGIAFTKTETVQVAIFSALVLGEAVSVPGFVAILVGLAGVVLISLKDGRRVSGRAMALGLLGGAAFGGSAIGYRGATLELGDAQFVFRAAFTLAAVTAMQTVVMTGWLRLAEPGQLSRVFSAWRVTGLVGLTGMLGSLCWFTAFTLQNAAYVRALGQVELVFGLAVAALVFRERLAAREWIGSLLLGISVVMLVLLL